MDYEFLPVDTPAWVELEPLAESDVYHQCESDREEVFELCNVFLEQYNQLFYDIEDMEYSIERILSEINRHAEQSYEAKKGLLDEQHHQLMLDGCEMLNERVSLAAFGINAKAMKIAQSAAETLVEETGTCPRLLTSFPREVSDALMEYKRRVCAVSGVIREVALAHTEHVDEFIEIYKQRWS